MKKLLLLVTLTLLVAGCSSTYKDAIEQGNKALDEQKYEDAVSAFELALNEKPDDEKALKGLEKAKSEIERIEREKEEKRKREEEELKKKEEEKAKKKEQQAIALEMLNNDIEKMIELGEGLVVDIEPYLPDDWEVTNVYVSDDWFALSDSDKEYIAEFLGSTFESIIVSSGATPYTAIYFKDKNGRDVATPKTFGGYSIK